MARSLHAPPKSLRVALAPTDCHFIRTHYGVNSNNNNHLSHNCIVICSTYTDPNSRNCINIQRFPHHPSNNININTQTTRRHTSNFSLIFKDKPSSNSISIMRPQRSRRPEEERVEEI